MKQTNKPSSAPVLSVLQHLMFPNHETGRHSVSEDGTLRIRDVRYEDEGQYVCQGLNVLGSEKALATIAVKGQPPPPSPSWLNSCQPQLRIHP